MRKYYQGEVAILSLEVRKRDTGALVDPSTSVKLAAKNPIDAVVIPASTDMTKLSTGLYEYIYIIPDDAMIGVYEWHPICADDTKKTKMPFDNEIRRFEILAMIGQKQ